MPAIRQIKIGLFGLYIETPDGKTALVTSDSILTRYEIESNNYDNTRAWIAAEIESQLGIEFITASMLTVEFDCKTGEVTYLEVTEPWLS